jgi:hypothetical protein
MGILVIAILLSTVSTAFASDYVAPPTPVINSFTASATNVVLGDTVTLKWNVSNAVKVEILGLEKLPEEDIPLIGEIESWPMASTTYVLNAYGANGTMISATVDVNVDTTGPLSIVSFTASATQIQSGDTVKLKWQVKNAKSIEIIGLEKLPEKELPILEGELDVWPLATTTYILQAVGFQGEIASKAVTVLVVDNPVSIESASISPSEITLGQTATISWKAINASKVNISGVTGDLPATGSVVVKPTAAGTVKYEISATGSLGDVAKTTVSLVVKEVPSVKILTYKASAYEVSRGTLVKLSWTTENATGCMILTSDGLKLLNRPANGSISITPNVTRTYTLVAYDADGNTDEQTIEIIVK